MPTLSAIVPNYNHGPYLKLRIDSILNQTYEDIEVIILDDNSQDNSVEIIESYRTHPKVSHILLNDRNSGSTFIQWEKGINLATGKWIWIAESDDWSEKTFLETLIPAFEDSKEVGIAFCQSLVVNADGKTVKISKNDILEEIISGTEFVAKRLLKKNLIINASMCVFKKEHYYAVSKKHLKYKFMGDWLFWIEMAARGNVFISGKVLNYFRKHSADITSSVFKSGIFFLEYLQFTDDLRELRFLTSDQKMKMIEKSFPKYYFSNISEKKVRSDVAKTYHKNLGLKYYLIMADTYFKKIKNKLCTSLCNPIN